MKHIVFRQFFRDFCSAAIYPAVFLLSVALLILLSASCSREDEGHGGKVGSGDYITFTATGGTPSAITKSSTGSSSENEVEQTYTIYYDFEKGENVASLQGGVSHGSDGNLTQSSDTRFSGEVFETTVSGVYAEYLDWVAGDKITIAQRGDRGSGSGYENLSSNYEVKNPTRKDDPKRSTATLTPVTGNGLQWREGTNYFAALYPDLGLTVSATTGGGSSSSYIASFSGTYEVMPSTQYCTMVEGGRTYKSQGKEDKSETWYAPNMRYAYMAAGASGVSSSGTPLTLSFYPQFSSVEVKLVKPASLSEANVKLTGAVLTGGNGGSTDASLSSDEAGPRMTLVNAPGLEVAGGSVPNIYHISTATSAYDSNITMKFKKSDGTADEPELNETTPVSFTFLMLPAGDLTQLELKLELEVTKDGITKTEAKTIKLQTVSGTTKTWIALTARKKLTITNMSTWIVDIVGPSAFTERIFTVSSDGQKVKFSPGNLQAVIKTANSAANARWQFADNQYAYPSRGESGSYSAAAGTTVDLFMHPESATGPHALGIPWSSSYSPTTTNFANWGQYCDIYPNSDPTSTPYAKNTYRTLKQEEWDYLLNTRVSGARVGSSTEDARYSKVTLNVGGTAGTISGMLIYPDGFTWTDAMGTAPVVNSLTSDFNTSSAYTLAQFEAMESAGVVFLPAAGLYHGSDGSFSFVGSRGVYWSTSVYSSMSHLAYNLLFNAGRMEASGDRSRNYGCSVRLVKDVVPDFTVSSDGKKVEFSPGNLQAVVAEAGSARNARWQFADNQYDYPSRANGYLYSAAAGTTVDLFMHPESGDVAVPNAFGIPIRRSYSPTTPNFADWGQNPIYPNSDPTSTPYAKNTYRTLKQEEWAYLLEQRESGARVGSSTEDARYSLINLNAATGTILGLLIYPNGFTWTSDMGAAPNVNSGIVPTVPYTLAQFEAMESAGVVFLPAAGFCYNDNRLYDVGSQGHYWMANVPHGHSAWGLSFASGDNHGVNVAGTSVVSPRHCGYSVRLVKDIN